MLGTAGSHTRDIQEKYMIFDFRCLLFMLCKASVALDLVKLGNAPQHPSPMLHADPFHDFDIGIPDGTQ
ncbi:hypothetical protein NW762_011938 [Fusarium torreyae]|uniref:Uncharacterized protein n=1 Tax=Fusarium torreyae TaxID=1237075 RepID=A0A9W8RQT9_9HYPO|nr:hypothetical protein NW762_011938 [Fusarium torreyae]